MPILLQTQAMVMCVEMYRTCTVPEMRFSVAIMPAVQYVPILRDTAGFVSCLF